MSNKERLMTMCTMKCFVHNGLPCAECSCGFWEGVRIIRGNDIKVLSNWCPTMNHKVMKLWDYVVELKFDSNQRDGSSTWALYFTESSSEFYRVKIYLSKCIGKKIQMLLFYGHLCAHHRLDGGCKLKDETPFKPSLVGVWSHVLESCGQLHDDLSQEEAKADR